MKWNFSKTIEFSLIERHVPPLAERVPAGYAITDRGRDFYREHYATHAAAYPDVPALHPDGAAAEPWPKRADDLLTEHERYYRALCTAWRAAYDAHQGAEAEAGADPPQVLAVLPTAVTERQAARHQLWCDTARQRADLAAADTEDLQERAERAARAYTVAALTAFRAAALREDPLPVLQPPGKSDDWDEQHLQLPPETGIHAIDAEVKKRHAAAVGAPLRRRGPAPKPRRRRFTTPPADKPSEPGRVLAELADYLHGEVAGGALTRRLHSTSSATSSTG